MTYDFSEIISRHGSKPDRIDEAFKPGLGWVKPYPENGSLNLLKTYEEQGFTAVVFHVIDEKGQHCYPLVKIKNLRKL